VIAESSTCDPWTREIRQTIAELQKLLRVAWPKAGMRRGGAGSRQPRYPADVYLYPVAVRIVSLRRSWNRREPTHQSKALIASARKLVRELGAHRDACARDPYCWQPELDRLDATQRQVEALLAFYDNPPLNPAWWLAEPLIEAWRRAGVKVALGTKVRGRRDLPSGARVPPLCSAVTTTLSWAGIKYAPQTVSDMLRDRYYTRPRSGIVRRGGRKMQQNAPAL
jgi:hypothetical protein